eukprot:6118392-Pleurochrysis_carterae.AAC.1
MASLDCNRVRHAGYRSCELSSLLIADSLKCRSYAMSFNSKNNQFQVSSRQRTAMFDDRRHLPKNIDWLHTAARLRPSGSNVTETMSMLLVYARYSNLRGEARCTKDYEAREPRRYLQLTGATTTVVRKVSAVCGKEAC